MFLYSVALDPFQATDVEWFFALEHFHVYLSHANKAARMAAVRIAGFQPALVRQTKQKMTSIALFAAGCARTPYRRKRASQPCLRPVHTKSLSFVLLEKRDSLFRIRLDELAAHPANQQRTQARQAEQAERGRFRNNLKVVNAHIRLTSGRTIKLHFV